MKKVIIYDTSVGSMNVGDQIINESFNNEMNDIINKEFVVRYPTHNPVSHFYQNTKFNRFYRYVLNCDYKFISGTNIISTNLFEPWPNWNVNIFNCKPYKNSILVGCGLDGTNDDKVNLYTKLLYNKILNKDIYHSVRDNNAKVFLEKLGYKAINTGCVTMWSLNKEHCKKIPKTKASRVIFTLTDYKKNKKYDQLLINILNKNYDKVYYWVQGSDDLEYFNSFDNINNIEIISPNLKSYKEILCSGDIDYIGTRLHAGVFAMQNFVRSIIIIVDNRARDIKENYNIVAIEREEISNNLEKIINSSFLTDINIKEEAIAEWKSQFNETRK